MSSEYTQIWTSKFSSLGRSRYHEKFFKRFEKNIKHRELIAFIEKFRDPNKTWCDFPIGPGRLFETINPKKSLTFGFDISDEFLAYNRSNGWNCTKKDITSFDLNQKFDLITTTNTLFAFTEKEEIMRNLVSHLVPGGVFITDLNNKDHLLLSEKECGKYSHDYGYRLDEIPALASRLGCEVLEISYHDCYDNRYVQHILERYKNSRWFSWIYRYFNKLYFKLDLYIAFEFFKPKDKSKYIKYLVAFKKIS